MDIKLRRGLSTGVRFSGLGRFLQERKRITIIIIKITISSIVIGFKNSYFPLIHLPSCYRTVCYWTVCYRTVQ